MALADVDLAHIGSNQSALAYECTDQVTGADAILLANIDEYAGNALRPYGLLCGHTELRDFKEMYGCRGDFNAVEVAQEWLERE